MRLVCGDPRPGLLARAVIALGLLIALLPKQSFGQG